MTVWLVNGVRVETGRSTTSTLDPSPNVASDRSSICRLILGTRRITCEVSKATLALKCSAIAVFRATPVAPSAGIVFRIAGA